MQVITCDAKGRLYLNEKIRTKYGERFVAVPTLSEVLLIPAPKDPVGDLREATTRLRGKSLKALRDAIHQQTLKQVKPR